ncbi:MAG: ABC transporter substrate-binding protein [Actinomycetota bacterium]
MKPVPVRATTVTVLAVVTLMAACASDDSDSVLDDDVPRTDESGTVDADSLADGLAGADESESVGPDSRDPADDTDAVDAPDDPGASSGGDHYPLTISHVFGETTIEAEPERVVTVLRGEHDFAIALDVIPTAQAADVPGTDGFFYPWTEDALDGAEPVQLSVPLNFEQIAAVEPDVIFATTFHLEPAQYEVLDAIAPTLAPPTSREIPTWQQVQRIFGEVLDRVDDAERVIDDTEARFAAVQAEHPEFVGASFTLPAYHLGTINSAATTSQRYQFVKELGLEVSDTVESMDNSAFDGFELGIERIDLVEADVVIWNTQMPDELAAVPTREAQLPAAGERREIVLDALLAAAVVQTNPLSISFAIERMVPELVAALDGDPDTVPPSAQRLYDAEIDAEQRAAMDAWEIAMDPSVPIADKRPHVEDFDTLAPTLETAATVAGDLGSITIEPKQATITDGTATVLFDVLVGDGSLTGQTATLDDVGGTWVARRDDICGYLGLIGVACPP